MKKFIESAIVRRYMKKSIDVGTIVLSYILILMIKYDVRWENYFEKEFLLILIITSFFILTIRKTNKNSWIYVSSKDVFNIGIDVLLINLVLFFYTLFSNSILARHLLVGNTIFGVFGLLTVRLFIKYRFINRERNGVGRKTLIVGAGDATDTLLREYIKNPKLDLDIIGLIDDDSKKTNLILHGYKVIGNRYDIPKIIEDYSVEQVIIAIPSANKKEIKELYRLGKQEGVEVKILPSFTEILDTQTMTSQVRDVKVEDLLGRDSVEVNTKSIVSYIEGKTVFVTGGAGSIGSELSRQIAKFNPKLIVNIDVNENSLYFLELEIKRNYKGINIVSEVCNIREKEKIDYLFEKYRPNLIYHAAAHKHVPLMEHNPEEAIKNNIFGTKNVVDLASEYKVEKFVLISTDKAVNPTNIMGATKRVAELIIEDKNRISNTKYMAVRFGNVLGSNGSVIPIFKKLIAEKKNLTVTHPEITRYFMTIPEASQLVLEAGSLGEGGEVFVLDMGEPVKIIDLAKNLIELSGLTLGVDIDIEISGLRPGEKLYEELLYDVNSALKTENKKIFIAKLKDEKSEVIKYLKQLEILIENREYKLIKSKMKEFIVTYKEPSHHNE